MKKRKVRKAKKTPDKTPIKKRRPSIPGKDIHPPAVKNILKDLVRQRFSEDSDYPDDIEKTFYNHDLLWQMMSPQFLEGLIFWLVEDVKQASPDDYIFPSYSEFEAYLRRSGCIRIGIDNNSCNR